MTDWHPQVPRGCREPSTAFVLMLGALMLVTYGVRWVKGSSP